MEIGVGPGSLLLRMAKKGYAVTGVEIRKDMAYEARKRVKEAGYDVDIIQRSASNMPFKDETFDSIVMTFVLAEIKDYDAMIKEVRRVLKKKGKVIIIAGGMPQDKNFFGRFIFKMVEPHTTLCLERDNKTAFERYGFDVKREDFGPFNIVNKLVAVKR